MFGALIKTESALMPALETLFDEKTSANKYIKIDSLDIDLEDLNSKNWQDELVQHALAKSDQSWMKLQALRQRVKIMKWRTLITTTG